MSIESERHVEAVVAALRLLECFENDVGLRAVDLQAMTGLQYSRVMRLTGTLASRGFLFLDPDTGRYFLGPSLFRLGQLVRPRYDDLASAVRPILRTLVSETEKTAMFSITDGMSRLVLCKQEPMTSLRYTVSEGQARPIASGASGRVILAFGPEALRQRVLKDLPEADAARLKARVAEIRDRGYDVSVSELTQDAFAVACPAISTEGELLGVLTLAGPSGGLTEALTENYVSLLSAQVALIPQASAVRSKPVQS